MKKHLLIVVLQLAASGSDAYFTHVNQSRPLHWEQNPIARPFIGSTPSLIAYFGAQATAKITLPLWFEKHGHRHTAEIVQAAGILDNSACATYSALHQNSARAK